jgi:hypothetical protein
MKIRNEFFSTLTKKDGKLVHDKAAHQKLYELWLDNLPENANVELFISYSLDNGSNAQLAKIHAMIKELANEIGYTFDEAKLVVKRKSGLCINANGKEYCKSFAKCSKEELNLVIQTLIDMGDFSGLNLR